MIRILLCLTSNCHRQNGEARLLTTISKCCIRFLDLSFDFILCIIFMLLLNFVKSGTYQFIYFYVFIFYFQTHVSKYLRLTNDGYNPLKERSVSSVTNVLKKYIYIYIFLRVSSKHVNRCTRRTNYEWIACRMVATRDIRTAARVSGNGRVAGHTESHEAKVIHANYFGRH